MKALRTIWALIVARPWLYALDVFLWTVIHAIPLVPPLLLRQVLDALVEDPGAEPVWYFVAAMSGYAIIRIGFILAGSVIDAVHRYHVSALLRYNVMRSVFKRPGSAAIAVPPGEALDSVRDDTEHLEDTVSWVADFFGELMFGIGAIIIMLGINARVTAIVFLPLLVIGVIFNLASLRLEKYRAASRDAASAVTGVIGETFTAVQAVQMAQAEEPVARHLKKLNQTRASYALRERKYNHLLDFSSHCTISIGIAAILLAAGHEMRLGGFTVGDFALFVAYLDYVTGIAEFYGYFVAYIQQGVVAVTRLQNLLGGTIKELTESKYWFAKAKEQKMASREKLEQLSVRDLTYLHPNSSTGIHNITFDIAASTLVVITGRMGSGKTTLLRALLGQLQPASGQVYWNDKLIADPAMALTPPLATYVRQTPLLLSGTIEENLLLGHAVESTALGKAIRLAVFNQDLDRFDHGLKTMVGVRGVKLSGGQVQRLAAARAMVHSPELLVFDDLSSALDIKTEEEMWRQLFAERQGTYLVVSHRPQVLVAADKIIVLKNGSIIDQGTYPELKERCEEFRQLLSAQESA
ncbi:MAG: ABC transporter ATP-binding protein [Peptococcaceae bacterium]|nr:ABC transporter ATP-binding protein [Peptococcaceae bacterium]